MTDLNIIMGFYKEQLSFCRHIEGQRSTMTNLILVIAAILIGFTYNDGNIIKANWPFPVLLIILGVYSFFFSKKHYALFKMHDKLSDRYREIIEKHIPESDVKRSEVYIELEVAFVFVQKHKLNIYWLGIPIVVTFIGVIMLIWMLCK